jgi:hypothetical protein
MPSITPINFHFLEKRMKKGRREGRFHVNERMTHMVWFYLERINKGEINLGVTVIGGWDWRRVYRIRKFEYVNHGL